jgi:DNA-binding transcriptional regulator YiaG
MTFAEKLKTTRESLGLSQAEAAALLECGKRTLEHWEAGDRVPLAITQEGALNRLRATKRPRTRKGQND